MRKLLFINWSKSWLAFTVDHIWKVYDSISLCWTTFWTFGHFSVVMLLTSVSGVKCKFAIIISDISSYDCFYYQKFSFVYCHSTVWCPKISCLISFKCLFLEAELLSWGFNNKIKMSDKIINRFLMFRIHIYWPKRVSSQFIDYCAGVIYRDRIQFLTWKVAHTPFTPVFQKLLVMWTGTNQ